MVRALSNVDIAGTPCTAVIVINQPVIHEDVRSPDVVRRNSDARKAAVFRHVPSQVVVSPFLQRVSYLHSLLW